MTDTSDKSFPVVGIGASAGGLEAVSEMIAELPATTGMAFLLVQHLDPVHESFLTELLAKKAAFTVETAADGAILRPDRLYVIPPNAIMTVADGVLRLRSRDGEEHPRKPVNILFRSLAEQLGHRAIAVVLSGTDSDGAQGMEAIKGAGGITMAQEPASAKFDGMPKSAIATGFVDFVRTPKELAREIVRIARHPYLNSGSPDGLTQEEDRLRRIFRLLQSRNGTDFSVQALQVQRRLARRMALRQIDGLAEYADLLIKEPDEVQALARDFLIRVTGFFRDPETSRLYRRRFFLRCSIGARARTRFDFGFQVVRPGKKPTLTRLFCWSTWAPRGFDAGPDFRYRPERCGDREGTHGHLPRWHRR